MKLYTYFASSGLETHEARPSSDSRCVVVEHGIAGEVIRRADLDASGPFYTTAPRAIRAFIERGAARLANPTVKLTRHDRRDWQAAIAAAKLKLESR